MAEEPTPKIVSFDAHRGDSSADPDARLRFEPGYAAAIRTQITDPDLAAAFTRRLAGQIRLDPTAALRSHAPTGTVVPFPGAKPPDA
jgi:hypothetical protein